MNKPIRVLLVEDHPIMRDSLREFLSEVAGVEVCGTAGTGEEGLRLCGELDPQIALIDVSLPGMSGLDLAEKLSTTHPRIIMLMLSGHQEVTYIHRAQSVGASGYILKGNPGAIVTAMNRVDQGKTYFGEDLDAPPDDSGYADKVG